MAWHCHSLACSCQSRWDLYCLLISRSITKARSPFFWALLISLPLLLTKGATVAVHEMTHTTSSEYVPFILLLLALFTVSGGIVVRGFHGKPALNTALLAIGTLLASFIGTTGASMVMIRPVLRANDDRVHNVHVFIFFIFLVSKSEAR